MNTPRTDEIIDIFLQPGDFYFGERNTRIRTLLGSCISITMWHPKLFIGGMCHYMLPSRGHKKISLLDGRYGEEAILMFLREAMRCESDPRHYVVKIFGGGSMFQHGINHDPCVNQPCDEVIHNCRNVACKNAVQGINLLGNLGFDIEANDMGGQSSRTILFEIWNGHVWVRKNPAIKGPV